MGKKTEGNIFWGLSLKGWLEQKDNDKAEPTSCATIHLVATAEDQPPENLDCPSWLWAELKRMKRDVVQWTDENGVHYLVAPEVAGFVAGSDSVSASVFGLYRDSTGKAVSEAMDRDVSHVTVYNHGLQEERLVGALTGAEIGHYRYVRALNRMAPPTLSLVDCDKVSVRKARCLGVATNVARHLVNLPPADLNPTTYSETVQALFSGDAWEVDVWHEKKLRAEKCGMLLAVGRAAAEPPCLVRMKYRPEGAKGKPIAIVGKGITFDSGGLDIKPAAAMRYMKKDMGGSASVVGLAVWAKLSKLNRPLDFYLACAENAIDAAAFRPSDVITARNGLTVEIHNTDAEGRLVLGDALDVAVTQTGKDKPAMVIDLATLTGAMRVALGLKVAGFFSTDVDLAQDLASAAAEMGDPMWQMPLVADYEPLLKSTFADISNAASVGFGGAITAALFLKRFVGDVPWAHIDMMAWVDKREGAFAEPGGNGQLVQALAAYLDG